jgi:hypothetical protein
MAFTPIYNTARYVLRSDNKTGFRGVSYDKKCKKYRAIAFHEGKQISLGWFDDVLEAGERATDFRLAHYPPVTGKPLCSLCKGEPTRYAGGGLCERCTAREYRRHKAEQEGRTLAPYKRRRNKAEMS